MGSSNKCFCLGDNLHEALYLPCIPACPGRFLAWWLAAWIRRKGQSALPSRICYVCVRFYGVFWIICWCVQPILTYGIVRFPLFMNAFQFCVIDTFIKFEKKQYCTREKKLLTLPPPAIRKNNANRNTHVATATAAAVTAAFTETTPLLPM